MSSAVLSQNVTQSYDYISAEKFGHTPEQKQKNFSGHLNVTNTKDATTFNKAIHHDEDIIDKTLKLFVDPHSCQLYERHVHQLKKLVKRYSKGFLLKDLRNLSHIINAISSNFSSYSDVLQTFLDLLTFFGHPFIKTLASDESKYKEDAIEAISQFAYLIVLPYSEIRIQVCKTLISLYSKPNQINTEINIVSKEFLKMIIDASSVCGVMMKSIELLRSSGQIMLPLMDLLKELTHQSPKNCNQCLTFDGSLDLCNTLVMESCKETKQIKFVCTEVLWNLVEYAEPQIIDREFNNLQCICLIKELFIDQLNSSLSDYDREFRNDILTVGSLIFEKLNSSDNILKSGFAKYIAILATYQEVKNHNILVKHLKLSSKSKADFELKKLAINCLITMFKQNAEIVKLYSENNVIPAMLYYLSPLNAENSEIKQDFELEELKVVCLKVLAVIGQHMLPDVIQNQGPKYLIEFIDTCVDPDNVTSTFLSSLSPLEILMSRLDQVQTCLLVIKNLVATRDKELVDEFVMQGIFERCLALLQMLSVMGSCEYVYVQTQIDLLHILAEICVTEPQYKEMFGQFGVELLIPRLNINLNEVDPIYIKLVSSTVNCIWSTVIANFMLEDYFMEKSGMFTLLDQLQKSPEILKNQLIGCLMDISSNPKSVNHILVWKGAGGISAPQLFCQMWREEDKKLLVPRDENNIITDLENPLKRSDLNDCNASKSLNPHKSQSANDVFNNIRAKIFGLFSIIGFSDLPPLEFEDHITLTIIQNYMNLKLGEIWREIRSEILSEDVRPITPDQEALEIITEGSKMRVEEIVKTQQKLVKAHEDQEVDLEQQCYVQIRELHLQDEYLSKKYNEHLERTGNYNCLKEAKNRMTSAIDASRRSCGYTKSDTFEKTTLDSLNITNFPGKKLQIMN